MFKSLVSASCFSLVILSSSAWAAEAGGKSLEAVIAAADAAAGEKLSKQCAACHSFNKGGSNRVGPNLWNVVGGSRANSEEFKYSDTMKATHDKKWGYEDLDAYLANPKQFIPGNKMSFPGISKAEDRANLIAWLRTMADKPLPLAGEKRAK